MQAFLFYIDDWLSSKQIEMMDAAEERGYLRLLLRSAKEPDCGLPDDDSILSIMSLLGPQWFKPTATKSRRIGETSGQKIRRCFISISPGRIANERMIKEFNHQKDVQEARRKAGVIGGKAKAYVKQMHKQTPGNCQANGVANEVANEVANHLANPASPSPNLKTTEEKTPTESKRTSPKNGSDSAHGSRFSIETLPEEWSVWCHDELHWIDPFRAEAVFQKFRDHWIGKAGKDGRKADWLATWRNWCRRESADEAKAVGRNGNGSLFPTRADREAARREELLRDL